jgi:hypothetical protein
MAKAYSNDLRERAAASGSGRRLVQGGCGTLRGQRCQRCEVVAAVAGTGSAAAKPAGNRRPRSLTGQRDWLLARLKAVPDLTLRALVAELRERGIVTSYGSVWRTVRDARLSFRKKDASKTGLTWRVGASAGARIRATSIPRGWSLSRKPGPRPT